jgi:hypothetical protein
MSVSVVIRLGRVRIGIRFAGKSSKRAILVKRGDGIGGIDDHDMGLLKVLDKGVQVGERNATACIISALPDRAKMSVICILHTKLPWTSHGRQETHKFLAAAQHVGIVAPKRANQATVLRIDRWRQMGLEIVEAEKIVSKRHKRQIAGTYSIGPIRVPPGTSERKYMLPEGSWPTLQLELMPLNELGTNEVPGTTPVMTLSAFQLLPVPIWLRDSGLKEVPMPKPRDMGVPLQPPGVPPEKGISPAPMRVPEPPRKLKSELPKRGFMMGTAAGMMFIGWHRGVVWVSISSEIVQGVRKLCIMQSKMKSRTF